MRAFQRQLRKLARRAAEFLAHPRVVLEQRRILENELLPRQPLERGRLLEQQPAGSPGLRGLQHLLAAFGRQAVERIDQFAERIEQGQADEQEAQQDELEKGAWVIHAYQGT